MIDRPGRDKLAELLHQFVGGRLTNDRFEDQLPKSRDVAVSEIEAESWFLYDDLKEHRLADKWRLSSRGRTQVAQWIMFLKTDLPYEWPVIPPWATFLFMVPNLLSLGTLGTVFQRWFSKHGDLAVWPFQKRSDFEEAKLSPKYLSGGS
jgi:hypothetical protein